MCYNGDNHGCYMTEKPQYIPIILDDGRHFYPDANVALMSDGAQRLLASATWVAHNAEMGGYLEVNKPGPKASRQSQLIKTPESLQDCYTLGYENPTIPARQHDWKHLVFINAYATGQADYQNQQPYNPSYNADKYDGQTLERNYSV